MRLLSKTSNILDMNVHFKEARDKIAAWREDLSPLLSLDAPCAFSLVDVKRDCVFLSLVKNATENDDNKFLLKNLLLKLLEACQTVMERQLESQLPGGKFWDPSPELQQEAASCSNTNISGERNFAMADMEIHRARHGKAEYVEGKVMYRVNKTGPWLCEMTSDEKANHIKIARTSAKTVSEQDAIDEANHREKLMEKLVNTRKKMYEKEDKDRCKVEGWLEGVFSSGGLWTCE